ncbi:MAG: HEAT repeat domain-containing protein, partial [Planctomycetota bacterium]
RQIPITAEHRAALREFAHPTRPFEVRSFALSVLAASAERSGEVAVRELRRLLHDLLAEDRDAAVRDLAARLLGTLVSDSGTIDRLGEAARGDVAWNVRYQALDALARFGGEAAARASLRACAADADPRVAKHARELLERIEGRLR